MTAVMERRTNGSAGMTCPRGRQACEVRGTLCQACSSELRAELRDATTPAARREPLNADQVFAVLRVHLVSACRDGVSFESAWRFATAAVIERVPLRDGRRWAVVLDATRWQWADAYARRRAKGARG